MNQQHTSSTLTNTRDNRYVVQDENRAIIQVPTNKWTARSTTNTYPSEENHDKSDMLFRQRQNKYVNSNLYDKNTHQTTLEDDRNNEEDGTFNRLVNRLINWEVLKTY